MRIKPNAAAKPNSIAVNPSSSRKTLMNTPNIGSSVYMLEVAYD